MAKFITYANGATEWRLQSISWRIGKGISILRLDVNFDWDYRSVKGRRPHPLGPRRNGGRSNIHFIAFFFSTLDHCQGPRGL